MATQNSSGIAQINGNALYYEDYGQGTPVVFVHGAFNTSEMWRPQIEDLATDHRVIVYDLRGHGRSGPTQLKFTAENLARDLDGLLEHLDATPAVVVGFSLGGCVAQEFATAHPDKLIGLVVSDSIGDSLVGRTRRLRALARGAFRFSTPFISRRRMLDLAGIATNAMQSDVQKYFMDVAGVNLERMSKDEILGIATALIDFEERDFSRFDKPALVIAGAREPRPILNEARRIAERIPGAELEIIENSQHGPNLENTEAFNAAIRRVLDAAEAAALKAA